MKKFYNTIVVCLVASVLQAQTAQQPLFCGFDYFIKMKETNEPEWHRGYEEVLQAWQQKKSDRAGGGGVYVIPVVFHIVYNTDAQNIADSVVHSQMEVLNEDYRRMNADAINTRIEFLPVAADTEIEFQLATFDPDGNLTNGITHTFTDLSGFTLDLFSAENTLDEVKHSATGGVDAWDTEHYLNIWICNIEPTLFGQIFGMSYPPVGLDNWPANSNAPTDGDDGVIVHYTTVGRNNPTADDDDFTENNLGRTLTHEVGHYLGLRHTWGDEFFTDPCSEDDGMADTPLCGGGDQYTCDYDANSCDEGADDLPDQLENYMDYTKDACYNMFTQEQRELMRFVLEGPRIELLNNAALAVAEKQMPAIHLYPVPAADELYVKNLLANEIYTYQLFDVSGQVIQAGTITQYMVDVQSLTNGCYVLRIEHNDGIVTRKFIKN